MGASATWYSCRSSEPGRRNVSRWLCELCSVTPFLEHSSNLRYRDMVGMYECGYYVDVGSPAKPPTSMAYVMIVQVTIQLGPE